MRAFTSICLKISVVIGVIGIIFCIIGASLGAFGGFCKLIENGGFQITYDGDDTFLPDVSDSFDKDQIKQLNIEMKYGEVYVQAYDGDDIKVEVEKPTSHYECEQDGDTLSIVDKSSNKNIIRGLGEKHTIISVYLPEDLMFTSANLEVGAGYMEAEDLESDELTVDVGAGEFKGDQIVTKDSSYLSVGTGHLKLDDSSLRNVEIDGGTGAVEYSGSMKGDNQLSCGVGAVQIDLEEKESDYNYRIQCDIGEAKIGGDSYSGLGNETSVDNGAENMLDIDCSVGQVVVTFQGR